MYSGVSIDDEIYAPYEASVTTDFAIEALIQVREGATGGFSGFSLLFFATPDGVVCTAEVEPFSQAASINCFAEEMGEIEYAAPDVGYGVHKYRLEVRRDSIALLLDDQVVLTIRDQFAIDSAITRAGQYGGYRVGIRGGGPTAINVVGFRVMRL